MDEANAIQPRCLEGYAFEFFDVPEVGFFVFVRGCPSPVDWLGKTVDKPREK
jgi:hypothetical protein